MKFDLFMIGACMLYGSAIAFLAYNFWILVTGCPWASLGLIPIVGFFLMLWSGLKDLLSEMENKK